MATTTSTTWLWGEKNGDLPINKNIKNIKDLEKIHFVIFFRWGMTIAIPKNQQILGQFQSPGSCSEKKPEIYLKSLQPGHWEVSFSRWWISTQWKHICNHQVGSFPKVEVKNLKHLKPPGSFGDCFLCFRCYSSVSGGNFAIPLVSWDPSHPFLHVYTCQHRSAIWKTHITSLNGPTFQGLYKFLSRHFT